MTQPTALSELEMFLGRTRGRGKVFLSHSSADKPEVERVKELLEERGVPIWYDVDQLDVGDSVLEMITKGIDDSDFPGYLRGLVYADLREGTTEQVEEVVQKLERAVARFNSIVETEIPA